MSLNPVKDMATAANIKKITDVNKTNLKAVDSGGKIAYQSHMGIVLIGKHTYTVGQQMSEAMRDQDGAHGNLEVQRQAIIGKGEIKVVPPPHDRSQFEGAMAKITKKKIYY
jgi:hypothetical protein